VYLCVSSSKILSLNISEVFKVWWKISVFSFLTLRMACKVTNYIWRLADRNYKFPAIRNSLLLSFCLSLFPFTCLLFLETSEVKPWTTINLSWDEAALLYSWKFIARISGILLKVVGKNISAQFDFGNFPYACCT